MRRHSRWCPAVLWITLGCAVPGERARTHDCPQGEVCSPSTPRGLYFSGASFLDTVFLLDGPKTTAVGGIQHVRVSEDSDGDSFFDRDFMRPFTAGTSDGALEIVTAAPPMVSIKGRRAGDDYLRILDRDTGYLLDRIKLQAKAVARVAIVPAELAFLDDPAFAQPTPWAVLAQAPVHVIIRLYGSGDDRLVDQGLSMRADAGETVVPASWDSFQIFSDGLAALSATVALGDGSSHAVSIEQTATIEDLVPLPVQAGAAYNDILAPLPAGESGLFCFHAMAGGLKVAGLTWAFAGASGLEIDQLDDEACVWATADTAGEYQVAVTAGTLTRTFPLQVVAVSLHAGAGSGLPTTGTRRDDAGERARAARLAHPMPPG